MNQCKFFRGDPMSHKEGSEGATPTASLLGPAAPTTPGHRKLTSCKLFGQFLQRIKGMLKLSNIVTRFQISHSPMGFIFWSLTQVYSVDFSQSMIGVKSAFSTNAQSRFASVVLDGVLVPPRLARLT